MLSWIGDYAFAYCTSLSQVELTSGLTVIGVYMFYMGGRSTLLTSITIPSSLTSIGMLDYNYCFCIYECIFYYIAFISLNLDGINERLIVILQLFKPNHPWISLGDYAFSYCSSLTQVELTSGLTVIGVYMFYSGGENTQLQSITIPSSITSIGRFYYCSLWNVC